MDKNKMKKMGASVVSVVAMFALVSMYTPKQVSAKVRKCYKDDYCVLTTKKSRSGKAAAYEVRTKRGSSSRRSFKAPVRVRGAKGYKLAEPRVYSREYKVLYSVKHTVVFWKDLPFHRMIVEMLKSNGAE